MIELLMTQIAAALPDVSSQGGPTIRSVALHLSEDGYWTAMAGGHSAVDLGEWCGDFDAEGDTAEDALRACLAAILIQQ